MKFLSLLTFLPLAMIVAPNPGLPPPNLIKRGTLKKPDESGEKTEGYDEEKDKNEKVRQNGDNDMQFQSYNGFDPLDKEVQAAKRETWENVQLEKFKLGPVEGKFRVYKTDSGHLVRLVEASGDPDARYGYIPPGPYYERRRALGSNLPPSQAGYRTSGLSRTSLANAFRDRARCWPFTSWYDDYSYGGYYPYDDYAYDYEDFDYDYGGYDYGNYDYGDYYQYKK